MIFRSFLYLLFPRKCKKKGESVISAIHTAHQHLLACNRLKFTRIFTDAFTTVYENRTRDNKQLGEYMAYYCIRAAAAMVLCFALLLRLFGGIYWQRPWKQTIISEITNRSGTGMQEDDAKLPLC